MGKEHLARLRIDASRIGLETTDTKQGLCYLHREHGWNITLTTRNDALSIELCQCDATSIMYCGEEVEATKCEALQAIALNKYLQGIVYLIGTWQ